MKTETTVSCPEFASLYNEATNSEIAEIWQGQEDGCQSFQDNAVYSIHGTDTKYFVLLREPSRVAYCMNLCCIDAPFHDPKLVSVWADWDLPYTSLLTQHLVKQTLQESCVMFAGKVSNYGMRILYTNVARAFDYGYRVGYWTGTSVHYYHSFSEFIVDTNVHWGMEPTREAKIIIRRRS
jgi:hypothetical protein